MVKFDNSFSSKIRKNARSSQEASQGCECLAFNMQGLQRHWKTHEWYLSNLRRTWYGSTSNS
jgi:hypothetical protein